MLHTQVFPRGAPPHARPPSARRARPSPHRSRRRQSRACGRAAPPPPHVPPAAAELALLRRRRRRAGDHRRESVLGERRLLPRTFFTSEAPALAYPSTAPFLTRAGSRYRHASIFAAPLATPASPSRPKRRALHTKSSFPLASGVASSAKLARSFSPSSPLAPRRRGGRRGGRWRGGRRWRRRTDGGSDGGVVRPHLGARVQSDLQHLAEGGDGRRDVAGGEEAAVERGGAAVKLLPRDAPCLVVVEPPPRLQLLPSRGAPGRGCRRRRCRAPGRATACAPRRAARRPRRSVSKRNFKCASSGVLGGGGVLLRFSESRSAASSRSPSHPLFLVAAPAPHPRRVASVWSRRTWRTWRIWACVRRTQCIRTRYRFNLEVHTGDRAPGAGAVGM